MTKLANLRRDFRRARESIKMFIPGSSDIGFLCSIKMFIPDSCDIVFLCSNMRIEANNASYDIELKNQDFDTQVERHEEISKFEEAL